MIRNVIFDMGNVLIYFDSRFFLRRLGVEGEDQELLNREVFRSLEWVRMDRGSLRDEEAVERICRRIPQRLHDTVRKLVCQWDQPMIPIAGMAELVKELKEAGHGIYLLSNASFRQHEYWPRVPGSQYFDSTYISCDHNIIKPQPEIYRDMLEAFGLKGEDCVFIDDVPANIEGAFLCGIPGIIFHGDVTLLRRQLRDMGVNVAL